MFDLERSIRDWRGNLTESLREEVLTELEGHLREEITQLAAKGLSAEEAFVIAVLRLGGERELCSEFAKVHPRAAVVRQFQWMIIAFLGISVLLSAFRALTLLSVGAVVGSGWDTNQRIGHLGPVLVAGLAGLMLVLVLVRVARGTLPTGRRLLTLGLLLFLAHAVLSLPLNVYLSTTLVPSGYGSVLLMTLPGRYASWAAALLVPCILIRREHARSRSVHTA